MANILTAAEAANFLRTDTSDAVMLMLLPQIDLHIQKATGRDWTADSTINPIAKAAAGMLLVQWYDDPGQANGNAQTPPGISSVLSQLEAEALKYRTHVFRGLSNAGSIAIADAQFGDDVISLTGVHGVSGDQRSSFESEISVAGSLKQTSSSNLYGNVYVAILKSPSEDVTP